MTQPPRSPGPPKAPLSTQQPSEWQDTARPSENFAATTAFGTTLFEAAAAAPPASSLFDVCHVGVVLRAVVFVNLCVAVAVAFASQGFVSWLTLATVGCAVALPGVLLWLVATCSLKRPLGDLALHWQWAAVAALGALSGAFGWQLGWWSGLETFQRPHTGSSAFAGALMACAAFEWLRLRAQAQMPADTTAKLAELQSRIRPHFLFNTLNTALSLVRLDPQRAESVLEDLAELFRVALTDTGASVTLGEEVELARRYLAIEQIRFGSRLQIRWELDPDASDARVPPLLLQPLVENAVRHGVEPSPDGGVIRVRTRVKLGRAMVAIDNTVPQEPSIPGNGIALRNVRERLHLMHDVAAQFDTRVERNLFRVQIVVPL